MEDLQGEVAALSAKGTGAELHILTGQLNYLSWLRSFKVVAQAKGLWNIFIEKETPFAQSKPDDFDFAEIDEVEDFIEEDDLDKPKIDQQIINDRIVNTVSEKTEVEDASKKQKKERRKTERKTLTPADISNIMNQTASGEEPGEEKISGPSVVSQEKTLTSTSVISAEKQYRLALYRFNLEAYERSEKRVHQAMTLLVYWVDSTIRERLQFYTNSVQAFFYLQTQYRMIEVRLQEAAQDKFERIHLSKCKDIQSYLNHIEEARQDILDFGEWIAEETIISKIMRGLTREYDQFVNNYHYFRDTDSNIVDVTQMTARLLTFDADLQQRKNAVKTLLTLANENENYRRFIIAIVHCDTCDKNEHLKKRCWETYFELKRFARSQFMNRSRSAEDRSRFARQSVRNQIIRTSQATSETRKILTMTTANTQRFHKNLEVKIVSPARKNSSSSFNDIKVDSISQKKDQFKKSKNEERNERNYEKSRIFGSDKDKDVTTCDCCKSRFFENCHKDVKEVLNSKSEFSQRIREMLEKMKEIRKNYQNKLLMFSNTVLERRLQYVFEEETSADASYIADTMMLISKNKSTVEQDKWILDFDANVHAVNNLKWFTDFHSFDMKVSMTDEANTLNILEEEIVEILITNNAKEKSNFELSQVAYSSNLKCNILSLFLLIKMKKLWKEWITNMIFIKTKENEEICQVKEHEELYILNFSLLINASGRKNSVNNKNRYQTTSLITTEVKPSNVIATIDFHDFVWKWHRRLEHIEFENLRRLFKINEEMNITDKQIKDKLNAVCSVCATSRAIFVISRDSTTRKYKTSEDLMHFDAWESYLIVEINEVKDFATLTDEACRYVWIRSYKEKKELISLFLNMLKQIERVHDIKVKRVRTDNEFVNNRTEAYFEKKNIVKEPTALYHYYQNEMIERNFRTERERTIAMLRETLLSERIRNIITDTTDELLQSSFASEKLWSEAWKHATWIKNRSSTRALKSRKMSWELLTDYVSNLSSERIWSSRCYVIISSERRESKLHYSREWMSYFMRCESEFIYRIWNSDKNQVARISTVRIDDEEDLNDS